MGFEYQSLCTGDFELPEGWRVAKIKEVADVNAISITKKNAPLHINYVDIASVEKGRLLDSKRMSYAKSPSRARRVIRNSDILVSTVRPNLEHYCFVEKANENTIASTGFAVVSSKTVDPRFLYYYLTSKSFTAYLTQIAAGHTSAYPAFNPDVIEDADIALPTEDQQRAISHVLGSLDDQIELNWRMNITLEEIAKQVFRAWFVNFAPVHAKAAGATSFHGMPQELFDSLPESFEESSIGELPKGWSTETLIQQAHWVNGAAYKNMHFSSDPDALPVIKIAELKKGISQSTKFTNTDLGGQFKISTGELLFSWSGSPDTSIDAFIWANGDAWLNQHVFMVRPNGQKSKGYLFALLKHLMPKFIAIAKNKQTTGLGHVTRKDMERMHICSPPASYLSWFSEFADNIYARILKNSEQIETLSSLRDTLLPKLISGEIEAPDLEALTDGG